MRTIHLAHMEKKVNIELILQWISTHPEWAVAVVFLIAFFESIAIFSLFVPGWVLLVGVGALIGSGHLDFVNMSLASFTGALTGESLSYYIGWHYRDKIHHWEWFAKHPHWLEKSQVFFHKHGASSVAFGRFFGPVRAFVPLVAGISEMPPMRFTLINIASALVWAPAYLMPGVIAGAAIEIDKTTGATILIVLLGMVIFSWLLAKEIRTGFIDKKLKRATATILGVPLPVFKGIISFSCLSIIIKLLFSGSLHAELRDLLFRVIAVISH